MGFGRQVDVRGTSLGANHDEACIAVLAEGDHPFERLVTDRFPLTAIEEAMPTFERRGTCIEPVIALD